MDEEMDLCLIFHPCQCTHSAREGFDIEPFLERQVAGRLRPLGLGMSEGLRRDGCQAIAGRVSTGHFEQEISRS